MHLNLGVIYVIARTDFGAGGILKFVDLGNYTTENLLFSLYLSILMYVCLPIYSCLRKELILNLSVAVHGKTQIRMT